MNFVFIFGVFYLFIICNNFDCSMCWTCLAILMSAVVVCGWYFEGIRNLNTSTKWISGNLTNTRELNATSNRWVSDDHDYDEHDENDVVSVLWIFQCIHLHNSKNQRLPWIIRRSFSFSQCQNISLFTVETKPKSLLFNFKWTFWGEQIVWFATI